MTEKPKNDEPLTDAEPEPLTDADFVRYPPDANQSIRKLTLEIETIHQRSYDRQIELLVTVRMMAASRNLSFEELVEASRLRYEETLE